MNKDKEFNLNELEEIRDNLREEYKVTTGTERKLIEIRGKMIKIAIDGKRKRLEI